MTTEEIKKEFTDILVEFGKVVEDVAIAGVRNPVGFKPTHLWKPAYDRAIERLLETIPSHDETKRESDERIREFVKWIGEHDFEDLPDVETIEGVRIIETLLFYKVEQFLNQNTESDTPNKV